MVGCQGVAPGVARLHFAHGRKKRKRKKSKTGVKNFSYIKNALIKRSLMQKNNDFNNEVYVELANCIGEFRKTPTFAIPQAPSFCGDSNTFTFRGTLPIQGSSLPLTCPAFDCTPNSGPACSALSTLRSLTCTIGRLWFFLLQQFLQHLFHPFFLAFIQSLWIALLLPFRCPTRIPTASVSMDAAMDFASSMFGFSSLTPSEVARRPRIIADFSIVPVWEYRW